MAIDKIITEFATRGEDGLRNVLKTLSGDFDSMEAKKARLNLASNAALAGGAGLAGAIGALGAVSLKSAGEIERVEAGLTAMLGSSDAAKKKLAELQQFAKETPFDFGVTAKSAQQLLAMGISADKIIPTLKSVGNAVAAGGGGTEQFQGVLTALGQIQTKGKISAEELMQMAERGIPVFQILRKELGLSQEQVSNIGESGIDAQKGIEALLKGMAEVGGGKGLETMSDTLPGKLSNLGDSANQAAGAIGKLFSQDAKDFVSTLSGALDKVRDFTEQNPALAKGILTAVGVGAAGAVGFGILGKLAGAYNEITEAVKKTTKGKIDLAKATGIDDAAEKKKAATAEDEGDAIAGVGDAVDDTKQKLQDLAKDKFDEFIADPKAALQNWKTQFAQFAAQPLTIGGRTFTQLGGGTVSNGLAMGSAAIGAAAGYGSYDDYRTLGASQAEALAAGAFTGVGAAAAAMFIPGAAVPIAIATGFRYAFNELVNVPMEKAAEGNISDDELEKMGKMSRAEKEAFYFKKRDEALAEGDDVLAQSMALSANNERKQARREGEEAQKRQWDKEFADYAQKQAEDQRVARLRNATDAYNSMSGVQTHRNGARTVTLRMPESSGDEMARQLSYNSNTAAPLLG